MSFFKHWSDQINHNDNLKVRISKHHFKQYNPTPDKVKIQQQHDLLKDISKFSIMLLFMSSTSRIPHINIGMS